MSGVQQPQIGAQQWWYTRAYVHDDKVGHIMCTSRHALFQHVSPEIEWKWDKEPSYLPYTIITSDLNNWNTLLTRSRSCSWRSAICAWRELAALCSFLLQRWRRSCLIESKSRLCLRLVSTSDAWLKMTIECQILILTLNKNSISTWEN